MRELLYDAADHFKRGKALAEGGDVRGALRSFEDALSDLHAVKPQRMRDVLLAYVHLSRYELAASLDSASADSDLRLGYSYARSTGEPAVRKLAENALDGASENARLERSANRRATYAGRQEETKPHQTLAPTKPRVPVTMALCLTLPLSRLSAPPPTPTKRLI